MDETESYESVQQRHSQFANICRALYESYTFYAKSSENINNLYHGINIKLFFKTFQYKNEWNERRIYVWL